MQIYINGQYYNNIQCCKNDLLKTVLYLNQLIYGQPNVKIIKQGIALLQFTLVTHFMAHLIFPLSYQQISGHLPSHTDMTYSDILKYCYCYVIRLV